MNAIKLCERPEPSCAWEEIGKNLNQSSLITPGSWSIVHMFVAREQHGYNKEKNLAQSFGKNLDIVIPPLAAVIRNYYCFRIYWIALFIGFLLFFLFVAHWCHTEGILYLWISSSSYVIYWLPSDVNDFLWACATESDLRRIKITLQCTL